MTSLLALAAEHALREDISSTSMTPLQVQAQIALLQELTASLSAPIPGFRPGDIVQWKPHMKIFRVPDTHPNAPMVVVNWREIQYGEDIQQNIGSAYHTCVYDIEIGYIDSDGVFLTYIVDSRRLQPYAMVATAETEGVH